MGGDNTASGDEALYNKSTGYLNTAVGGVAALLGNGAAWANPAVRTNTLLSNLTKLSFVMIEMILMIFKSLRDLMLVEKQHPLGF